MYSSALPSISALYGGGWSTPRPGRFTPRKDPVPIEQEAGQAPRAGLDWCGKSLPHRDSISGTSIPQRVAKPTELSRPPISSCTSGPQWPVIGRTFTFTQVRIDLPAFKQDLRPPFPGYQSQERLDHLASFRIGHTALTVVNLKCNFMNSLWKDRRHIKIRAHSFLSLMGSAIRHLPTAR